MPDHCFLRKHFRVAFGIPTVRAVNALLNIVQTLAVKGLACAYVVVKHVRFEL